MSISASAGNVAEDVRGTLCSDRPPSARQVSPIPDAVARQTLLRSDFEARQRKMREECRPACSCPNRSLLAGRRCLRGDRSSFLYQATLPLGSSMSHTSSSLCQGQDSFGTSSLERSGSNGAGPQGGTYISQVKRPSALLFRADQVHPDLVAPGPSKLKVEGSEKVLYKPLKEDPPLQQCREPPFATSGFSA